MKPFYFSFLCFCLCFEGLTQTVNLVADKDNMMLSEDGTKSNGAGSYIFAGKTGSLGNRRALIHFDLSIIPVGATITSATLTITIDKIANGGTNKPLAIHKINKDWGEGRSDAGSGEGKGAPAQTNDATWINNFYPTSSWGASGGDFDAAPSASTTVGDPQEISISGKAGENPTLMANVQSWINTPSNNFGWLLRGDESGGASALRILSRENGITSSRPTLSVTYSVLPVTLLSFTAKKQNNQVLLQWVSSTETNSRFYDIQSSSNGSAFSSVSKISAAGNSSIAHQYNYLDANPQSKKIFYRLAQHDIDGKINYSPIIAINFLSNKTTLVLSPNPTTKTLTLITGDFNLNRRYTIINTLGTTVKTAFLSSNTISVESLPAGLYRLNLENADKTSNTVSFIKQ